MEVETQEKRKRKESFVAGETRKAT